MNAKRGGRYGQVQMALASAHSTGDPACAVVVAAYRVSSWDDGSTPPPTDVPVAATTTTATTTTSGQPAAEKPHSPNGRVNGVASHWTTEERAVAAAAAQERRTEVPYVPPIKVTDEKEVDFATARRFYEMYRESFGPMATKAVARQLLHESEFIEEMLDPRVHKFVAWNDDDEAIGMTTLTQDLETVPWISPAYFEHHYPEHHARNGIFYLGFTLVHPDYQGKHVFHAMLGPMWELVRDYRPLVAWDMCLVNDELGLGGSAGRLFSTFSNVTVVQVDRQNYYVGDFHEPLDNPTA